MYFKRSIFKITSLKSKNVEFTVASFKRISEHRNMLLLILRHCSYREILPAYDHALGVDLKVVAKKAQPL